MKRTYIDYIEDVLTSIQGMRDKLIHEYHGVDLTIVWEVIEKEIPSLKPKFKEILEELKS